jgi:allantoinase
VPSLDLLIRRDPEAPIGIADGRIVSFEDGPAREVVDATGLIVLPGAVDAHVHFNEPGRADWEGWATGSRAAIAGGVTTVCDMPLNSTPPVIDVEAFEAKRAAAAAQSYCDYALWGGLVPGRVDAIEPLASRGVVGFKAFLCHSGIDDFPRADLATLREGMRRAAAVGLPVGVHAEIDPPPRASADPMSVRDYLASRPVSIECDAVRAALDLAGETGCALHIVHVSSGSAMALIVAARARGVDVTAETCPHYLLLDEDDVERIGAAAKCAPPMRGGAEREGLWRAVHAGDVDTIGSDHSPAPWSMKTDPDFGRVWGGIAGVQHLLPLMLTPGLKPRGDDDPPVSVDAIVRLCAGRPAERFRLRSKGRLEIGADADLTLMARGDPHEITADGLEYRHRVSPWIGRRVSARVRRTILRGETVFGNGEFIRAPSAARPIGRLTTPS